MNDTGSLQYQAYHTIKEQILSKSLDSEVLYSETRMAKELGISRTPLREALQYLSQEGYITIIPSRGFMIRRLDKETMRESIQVRCAIEGFCVHLAAGCDDKKRVNILLKDMEESLTRQKAALSAKNFPESFTEEDHKFHMLLVHFAENSEFNHLFQRLLYTIHLTTANALTVAGRAQATYEEHLSFYQHLKKGDSLQAYNVLITHLMMPLNMNII
ncbi:MULTISPECIES: GntR family transcriptional regulator [Clostridia]|uniref:GntR family transcriptional regulator n=1 Tax=Clostridia TaxID=186801 RepID=UPI0012B1941B|nr:GntR family transcriptional regulator [Clostridium sp. WB02_MRS01]MBW4846478.1 GntR family transcriptional regulator [Lachnospiraceae bacterium]MSS10159.1 GntR family transcriptional regulator [Clostridium sp. WB02_MRS01]